MSNKEMVNKRFITTLVYHEHAHIQGGAYRDRPRTLDRLLKNLTKWLKANPDVDFSYPTVVWAGDKG